MGMGETAENLAGDLNISRSDQEEFSISSHRKALAAISEGKFKNEILSVEFNGETLSVDEGPREPDQDKIKSLSPAFDEGYNNCCYIKSNIYWSISDDNHE